MPLINVNRPNQKNQNPANDLALVIEEFTGIVEGTLERRSALKGWVPVRPVKGTATLTNHAIGESTLGKVTIGDIPPSFTTDFSKTHVTIDTVVYARQNVSLLENFQTNYDTRKEIGVEHGKKIAKFFDESFFIQAIKAARLTESAYYAGSAGRPAGHFGGSVQTLNAAADRNDPALLYAAIASLFVQMENKDVNPAEEDVMLTVRPQEFYTLLQAEQIINGNYITADGTTLKDVPIFKTYGVPVISSNNLPNTVVTNHLLSNASNGNAYNGDFTKVVAAAFSPRALLAGETIPLETDVYYDKISKLWFIDAHLAYGVTANRAEFAGVIQIP